jgi:hypothetical protein
MRRLLCVTIAILAVALCLPAAAAPVSTGRVATARFQLQPDDGVVLHLEVTATVLSAGDRMEVGVQRCEDGACAAPVYYAGMLPKGALTIDAKSAAGTLRTVVGGLDLSLDWSPVPAGTAVVGGMHGGGTDGDMAFTISRVDPAAATVLLDGAGCKGAGAVGDAVRVEVPEGSNGPTVPLRRLRLRAGAPVCGG